MKLMVTWKIHPGKLPEALASFSQLTPEQDQAVMGPRLRLIGRWHDLVRGRGVAIFDSDSVEALSTYSLNWNGVMDLEVGLVLDDAETRAAAGK
jgi:hypothetical protein